MLHFLYHLGRYDICMKKMAIIGASYLQLPLILKAQEKNIETHVFAWKAGDIGEKKADYFYPISIIEKEKILVKCLEIGIDGICSIASDLANITVNYVANKMNLIGNPPLCAERSTNKHKMRQCFDKHGDPSPKSIQVKTIDDLKNVKLEYPIIVKPIDRSGSRGITKLDSEKGLRTAIERAKEQGFQKYALVEEYVTGQEFSVEYISWKGQHTFVALTKKYTTGTPHFIETAHIEPVNMDEALLNTIKDVVSKALTNLGILYGASHSEIKISQKGSIKIIEIGSRMGGDCIGSSLVELSTGFDFVGAVIDIALGIKPQINIESNSIAAIRFVISEKDIKILEQIKAEHPEILQEENIWKDCGSEVTDSGSRFGYYIFTSKNPNLIERYLPKVNVY